MKGYNDDYGGGNSGADLLTNGVDYNMAGSSSVGNVESVNIVAEVHSLPTYGTPNSVTQNYRGGKIHSERYYDKNGQPYLDIDYTDHGNKKTHPKVPHQHKIVFINGEMHRDNKDTEVK